MASETTSAHAAVGAWFLGPRAENFDILEKIFKEIITDQAVVRKTLYGSDPDFITEGMKENALFKNNIQRLTDELRAVSHMLSQHSVPFWSPRYNAHMSVESSMPGIIGYLVTMMYNPNNVALEASPFTTLVEKEVGLQMCEMLGFNRFHSTDPENPTGWGHITCGGSVANLESVWAARNLKFYPLSLKLAILEGPLKFLATIQPSFQVTLCTGAVKDFMSCSTWELLNLTPATVLGLPDYLYGRYGISQTFLQNSMYNYSIQTVGKDYLEEYFHIEKPAQFFVGTTKHYSWPKAAAITGIGSENVVDVPVDYAARMDVKSLVRMLEDSLLKQSPVYAVVAIMGSTEQGAVDPLAAILRARKQFQARGLSFVVHCDAAWGGYFASMLRSPPGKTLADPDFVPSMALKPYTANQLDSYDQADSITIDPHKSGYLQYPAGGLCYRDERMRYLVTWTSPIVYRAGDALESMGVYGVEGSKPGAAAVATYLSHEVIGLHANGYGTLLGEATFTCARLYTHWATMTVDDYDLSRNPSLALSDLIVVPFNMLPTELEVPPDPKKIAAQKEYIRKNILKQTNEQLRADPQALELLGELGSDLMINAFACNFRINGKKNTNIIEANYLNQRIFERLSISKIEDKVADRPIILTSSTFSQSQYGACLTTFKKRLGLEGDQDLYVLVNVTMSPWPTTRDFQTPMIEEFREIADSIVEACQIRNRIKPCLHGFVMQGTDKLHLVHLPMFNMQIHRYQVIMTADIPPEVMAKYKQARVQNPNAFFLLGNVKDALLPDIARNGASFEAEINIGYPAGDKQPLASGFMVTNVRILIEKSLESKYLKTKYPEKMPFYLYGTPEQVHIDHILDVSPNMQLNSDRIKFESNPPLTREELAKGVVAVFEDVGERSMQPLSGMGIPPTRPDHNIAPYVAPGLNFTPRSVFNVTIFRDLALSSGKVLASGRLALGETVFSDGYDINDDPAKAIGEHQHGFQNVQPRLQTGGRGLVVGKKAGQKWQEGWHKARKERAGTRL